MAAFVVWMQRSGQLPPETPVVLSQVAFRVLIPCFLMTKVCTPFQRYLLYVFDSNYVYLISRVKYSYWFFKHMVWRKQCFGLLGSVSLSTNLTLPLLKFKMVFVLNVCHFSAGCSDTCLASFSKFTLPSPFCHCSGAGFRFTLVCVTLSRFPGAAFKSIIYVLLELVQTNRWSVCDCFQVLVGAVLGKLACRIVYREPASVLKVSTILAKPVPADITTSVRPALADQMAESPGLNLSLIGNDWNRSKQYTAAKKEAIITAACAFGNSFTLPLVSPRTRLPCHSQAHIVSLCFW